MAACAVSPLDLIPDFVPVLQYLDDAVLLPFGILIAASLNPASLMTRFRDGAARRRSGSVCREGMAANFGLWRAGLALEEHDLR